jgi:hypothetical protein
MEIFIDLYHATVFPAKYKKSHFLITVVKLAVDILISRRYLKGAHD